MLIDKTYLWISCFKI